MIKNETKMNGESGIKEEKNKVIMKCNMTDGIKRGESCHKES